MDRETYVMERMRELLSNLQPFFAECEKKGYPIKKVRIMEMYPGDITTSFFVNVLTEWAGDRGFLDVAMILEEILADTLPKDKYDTFSGFIVAESEERFKKYAREPQYLQLSEPIGV